MGTKRCTVWKRVNGGGGPLVPALQTAPSTIFLWLLVWLLAASNDGDARRGGGGVYMETALNNFGYPVCKQGTYFPFRDRFTSRVSITGFTLVNNTSPCKQCSGGGLAILLGGEINISNALVVNNSAGQWAGGLAFGLLPIASCQVTIKDSRIEGNDAHIDGAQLYSTCQADLTLLNTSFELSEGATQVGGLAGAWHGLPGDHPGRGFCLFDQVTVTQASNVTVTGSRFQCPVGSAFTDVYKGMYGINGSFPQFNVLCQVDNNGDTSVLMSQLAFQCSVCDPGFYTLSAGLSDGSPGMSSNVTCSPCPLGGKAG